jgi:serine/threonine protein kinase
MSTIAGPGNAGTARWQAPELFEGGKTSKITDIFSLGVVLWEIYSNEIPFSKQIIKGKVQEIKTNEHVAVARMKGLKLIIPEEIPPQLKKMIELCLRDEPEERPVANQILKILKEEFIPSN